MDPPVRPVVDNKDDLLATEHIELDEPETVKSIEEPVADAAEKRRLARKISLRLIPMLALVYSFSVIDRINIGQVSYVSYLQWACGQPFASQNSRWRVST